MASRRRLAIAALSVATTAVVGAQLTGRGPVPEALESSPQEPWATPTTVTRPPTTTTVPAASAEAPADEPSQAEVDGFLNALADASEAAPAGGPPSQADIDAFLNALAGAEATSSTRRGDCHPNYGGCVPIDTDVDCAGGNGDGPSYAEGVFPVYGEDVYGLDPDGDLQACEPV